MNTTEPKAPRIFWDSSERGSLNRKVKEIIGEAKEMPLRDFLAACNMAQEEVIVKDRQRPLFGWDAVKKTAIALGVNVTELGPKRNRPSKVGKIVESLSSTTTIQQQQLTAASTPLSEEVVERAVLRALSRILMKAAGDLVGLLEEMGRERETTPSPGVVAAQPEPKVSAPECAGQEKGVAAPVAPLPKQCTAKGRTPTFVLMGMIPPQVETIKTKFNGQAKFRLWLESDGVKELESMLRPADACIGMLSSHRLGLEAQKRARDIQGLHYYPVLAGGVKAVEQKVSELLNH